MSGSSATSTLDIVLKDDVSAAAKAIAAGLEKVQAEAKSVDEALAKSGTRDGLQARLKSLGASTTQIEGVAKAWKDYAAAEELAADKSKWTGKQAAAVKNWENVTVAGIRAVRGEERARAFAEAAEGKKAEERRERENKRRVEEAERTAKAEADASRRTAEMAARDTQRRQEVAARDAARRREADAREAERDAKSAARDVQRREEQDTRDAGRAAQQAERDQRRLAEQEARDERLRVERRMRDDRMLAEHQAREEHRAAEAAHRHQEMLVHQREHAIAHHGVVNFALTSAAMAVSAHAIAHTGEQAWEHGAELQHERLGLRNAGRTPEQVAEIEAAARDVIANTPTASMVESMKVVAETTAAFGSVHHAIENLPFMMKAMSILKTAGGDNIRGDAASLGQAFAKTFEERQTKPEEFEHEAKQMIPAMIATGGVFNPEQLYAFAQQAKSALPSLSMRFLSKIAPSLIGAQGGERAGTSLKAFEDVIAGKVNDKKQAEAFLNMGLLDPKMAIMKAGHAVGWKSGAVKDTFLAMTDPLAWSEKYLIPALQKQGVDTSNREAVQMILNTMFRNQNANMFATEIAQEASRQRLHKDEALFSQTADFDEAYKRNLQDFGVASGALKEALGNLAGAATGPMMHLASNGIMALARKLNEAAELAFQHPNIAAGGAVVAGGAALAGAGWMSYQLMNGFGLGGAATALTGSAGAIDAAAARLGATGAGGAAADAVKAAEGAAGGASLFSRLAMGLPILGAGIFVADAMLNHRDPSKSLVDGGRPDVQPWDNNLGLPGVDGAAAASGYRVPSAYDREARARASRNAVAPPVVPDPVGMHDVPGPEEYGPNLPRDRPWTGAGAAAPNVTPQVDTSPAEQGLMGLISLSSDAGSQMQTALNVTASPTVDPSSINAASAAVDALIAKLAQVGAAAARASAAVAGVASAAGGANAFIGARRSMQRAPTGATSA